MLLSIGCGLGAALAWGVANLLLAKGVRDADPVPFAARFQILEALMLLPIAGVLSIHRGLPLSAVGWPTAGGVFGGLAILVYAAALRRGAVGIVAVLGTLEGVTAVLLALATGAPASAVMIIGLVVTVPGALLAGMSARRGVLAEPGALLAILGAALFGVMLWTLARAPGDPVASVVAVKAMGAIVVLALLRPGRLRWDRTLIATAIADLAGFLLFTVGAQRGSSTVTAVIGTQFGLFAMLGSFLVFHERISRRQLLGVMLLAAGVTLVTTGSP
jgi:drug/metabolite transporter (DMT)-like permease